MNNNTNYNKFIFVVKLLWFEPIENVDITFDIFYSEINDFGKPPGFIPADDVIMDERREKSEREIECISKGTIKRERERERDWEVERGFGVEWIVQNWGKKDDNQKF